MQEASSKYKEAMSAIDPDHIEDWIFGLSDKEKQLILTNNWPELWYRYYHELVEETLVEDSYIYFGPTLLGLAIRKELQDEDRI